MDEERKTHLLDLDNHLLCEVFKSVSVCDKQQNVQRTCMRFRAVLQQPSFSATWGSITVKLMMQDGDCFISPQRITQLIIWLLDRKSGIEKVKLFTEHKCCSTPYVSWRAAQQQEVLHAVAAAMAAEDVPMHYCGSEATPLGQVPMVSAPLRLADMDAGAVEALQQCAEKLGIRCSDFQPQHWEVLCSFRRLKAMAVCLQASDEALPAPYNIQSMQLTRLRRLTFTQCSVSLQPVLQHLSALTLLTTLRFSSCSKGLSALSAGMPPLQHLVDLTFSHCGLIVMPPLAQLLHLKELNLDGNPGLRGAHLELRGLTALTKLSMQRTPVDTGTLDVVQQLPSLKRFSVRGCMWFWVKLVFLLSRLKRWGHAVCTKLVVQTDH